MNFRSTHLFPFHCDGLSDYRHRWVVDDICTLENPSLVIRMSKVLRMRPGNEFILFDDSYHFRCVLEGFRKHGSAIFRLISFEQNIPVALQIRLFVGLLRRPAFEQVAYYAAQLGVRSLYPLVTECVQRSWEDKKEIRRLKAVMVSAREQAKSFCEPNLHTPIFLNDVADIIGPRAVYFESDEPYTLDFITSELKASDINEVDLFLGPEGGFTSSETSLLRAYGLYGCHLTPTILRTPEAVLISAGAMISAFS